MFKLYIIYNNFLKLIIIIFGMNMMIERNVHYFKNDEKNEILVRYEKKFEEEQVKINNDTNNYITLTEYIERKSYEIIEYSGIFDKNFYLQKYPDVKRQNIDPIKHYLEKGFKEGCNPNSYFNTLEYIKNIGKTVDINPFVHYILYSSNNQSIQDFILNKYKKETLSNETINNIMNAIENQVTIIIPIYNAFEDTEKCIESVLKYTTLDFELILIDDNSSDERISDLLNKYSKFPNIKTIKNKINQGFTRNINLGIQQTTNDVIILNSDTIVTPKWIQKILISAYSDERIGTVTPISNASDISVPEMNKNNEIPSFLNIDEMASLVEKTSVNGNMIAPTGNGFCMFIKRSTINDIGLFDEKNFGKGYGEETDFTMRANINGWKNVRNDSIFIYHKRSASFSLNKADILKKEHSQIIKKRYPTLFKEWGQFINSTELNNSISNIAYNLKNFNANLIKKNLLYLTNLKNDLPDIDNVKNISKEYNIFVLTIEKNRLKLWYVLEEKHIFIKDIPFNTYSNLNHVYLNLFSIFKIDLVFLKYNDAYKFLDNSPKIFPIHFASKMGIEILYGKNSNDLLKPPVPNKENRSIIFDNIIAKNEKGVIYTAIFGDYDELQTPEYINTNLDYICFTDNPNLKSDVWEIRLIDNLKLDNTRKARLIKILPHKYLNEYDYSIWVDGAIKITNDIFKYINKYSTGKPLLGIIHPYRNCIYDEANACINSQKDDKKTIKKQITKYKQEDYPKNNGLIESGVLFRKHNDSQLIHVMEDWFYEVLNYSKRDQLSLNYILWKNNFSIDYAPIFMWRSQYFEHSFHGAFDSEKIDLTNVRVIILDNKEYSSPKKSIDSVQTIGNIPISLITFDKNYENKSIHIITLEKKDNIITKLNDIIKNCEEDFIYILYSGDLIKKNAIKCLNSIKQKENNISNIGAIIFDYETYYTINSKENFKPGFSPELYLEYDYIKNSVLLNKKRLCEINCFDKDLKNNFIRDAIIKLYDSNYKIIKEDIIGFKLDALKKDVADEDKLFIEKILNRKSINVTYESKKLKYGTNNKKASIIIPFKDQIEVTETCVTSILNKTSYSNYEILLIDNNSSEDKTYSFIEKIKNNEKIKVISYNHPFNYSKINNFASTKANGDILIFLNNDTEILSPEWLDYLIGDSIQPNIGGVGAKLYYPDLTIQHAGVIIGLNGLAGHLFSGEKEENIPNLYKKYRRNCSAVTGACLAIERNKFNKIGGFDELFEVTGSDVEICLRLMKYGYRNVFNPHVKLIHHEKKTRSKIKVKDIDIKLSLKSYGPYLKKGDPFFNKNLSLNSNKLLIKEKNETPQYEIFIKNYNEEKSNQLNRLNSLINKSSINKLKFDGEVLAYNVSKDELEDNNILMHEFFKNPKLKLNKVTWFIPFFDHIYRGGIYTIFRIANYLSINENTINSFVLKGGRRREISEIESEIKQAFPNLKFKIIDLYKFGKEKDLPYSDAAFCTLWTTAYSLVKYNNCKAKFYLNQDYEPLFNVAGSVYGLIEETYRFNFIGIANTKGVKDKYKQYNKNVEYFTPSIDKKVYFPNLSKKDMNKKRIVFYGRPNNPRNGFVLGVESLKIVKEYFGDQVEIYTAGSEFDVKEYGLEGVITNLGLLDSIEKVAELYRKCDVGLVFMFTPHPSYQPLEYMACGCATVTNINENNMWLLKDKYNSILTEPTISCVAENIIELLTNEDLRYEIIKNGLKTVENLNWETELEKITEFIKNPIK